MGQRVFLSHNFHDKPLVEAVALKLAEIFGQEDVFYDSWSIRPGDGIIAQMNNGLEAPEFVFFFVSATSLASEMVKLEWQSALYAATKGKTRLVPVRVDGSEMPAILNQTYYIDMHTNGLDAAIAQIVGVVKGDASFTPQHQEFSNIKHSVARMADGTIEITVRASHMLEPNPNFAFPLTNVDSEVSYWIKSHAAIVSSFRKSYFQLTDGSMVNAVVMRPMTGSLTPTHPLTFEFKKKGAVELNLIDVLHDQGQEEWARVPPQSQP